MDDKKDILLTCLKFGYDKRVSYNETKQHLLSQGLLRDLNNKDFNNYFFVWFFDNFFHQNIHLIKTTDKGGTILFRLNQAWMNGLEMDGYSQPYDDKCLMTFEARQNYLNYLSLKESDRKATMANKLAWTAIVLTVLLSVGQIYFSIKQDSYNQRQEQSDTSKLKTQYLPAEFVNECKKSLYQTLADTATSKRLDTLAKPTLTDTTRH